MLIVDNDMIVNDDESLQAQPSIQTIRSIHFPRLESKGQRSVQGAGVAEIYWGNGGGREVDKKDISTNN